MNDILRAASTIQRGKGKKSTTAYTVMKKKYTKLISEEILIQGGIPATPYKRIWVGLTWIETAKARDPDNVRAGIKFILDAMVHSGVVEDDKLVNIDSIADAFERGDKRAVRVVWGEA